MLAQLPETLSGPGLLPGREIRGHLTRPGGGVRCPVGVHGDDQVRNVQERPGTARDEHRGHALVPIQGPNPVDERSDGFAFVGHQGAHALISDHEVGGAGVLVQEQHLCSGFNGLRDRGRLRRGTRGIRGTEPPGVRARGEVGDERRNVRSRDRAAVLRAHGHGIGPRDHQFAAVTGHVVVHPVLDGLQQRGLAVIAPAHDHGHALGDAQAGDLRTIAECERDPQVVG